MSLCKLTHNWISLIWIILAMMTRGISTDNGKWIMAKMLPDENGPLSEMQTAVGLEVSLPCDLTPTVHTAFNDKVTLVIWYRETNTKPIYTLDARGKPLQQAIHWSDVDVLGANAHFYYDADPPVLRIRSVKRDDAGLYRCRVDFQKSPTRNSRINLNVLVPPTQLVILDGAGAAVPDGVDYVGPYREGTNVNVTCMSSGGMPAPRVSWWREHALVDDSFNEQPDGSVKNVLQLTRLMRAHLHQVFTCQATNGHVMPPLSKAVKLEMTLAPLFIRLQGLNHPLTSGVKTHITCSSAGARPPPTINWHKDGQPLLGASQTTSTDGNITLSEMVFIPVPEDNGRSVTCSVLNELNGLPMKDYRQLDVKHAPIVTLKLGAPLDSDRLMIGTDVYMECDIRANPAPRKVEWYHNERLLNSSRGVIITNQTLVLQAISRTTHGQYMCRATNIQASVASNEIYLDVKYPPNCASTQQIIRAAIKQTVEITCAIDANPMDNLIYKWSFNNTMETHVDLAPTEATNHYRVDTFQHFGTLSCSAFNSFGESKKCYYHLTAAEVPDPVENCFLLNVTANTVHVSCTAGNDGGIPQNFYVEMHVDNEPYNYNQTFKQPMFILKRLPSDTWLELKVTAINMQGAAARAGRLRFKTQPAPMLRTASSTAVLVQLTPLLGALLGVVATLLLVAVCIVIFVKVRGRRHSVIVVETTEANGKSRNILIDDEKNPDVVPQKDSDDDDNDDDDHIRGDFNQPTLTTASVVGNNRREFLYTMPSLSSNCQPVNSFSKQYGELSLTANPSYALYYNSPRRQFEDVRPAANIYTPIPSVRNFSPTTTATPLLKRDTS